MTSYLSLEDILRWHERVVQDFGGTQGVRAKTRLKSVVEAPRQDVFGKEQYPTLCQKAAVYLRNIIADHPFVDGNKRTAVVACGIFLQRNGRQLTMTSEEWENLAIHVAVKHLSIDQIAVWLEAHTK